MSRPAGLTSTSFVVLGLLCVRSWSAYELAQQFERGWADVWPRAARGIYHEPKKLVAHGYATSRSEPTGRRRRTTYEVTDHGREAFRAWLAEPSAPPVFESEALVRVLFADQGSLEELRSAVTQIREHARQRSAALLEQGADYLAGGGPFPERLHLLHLVGGLLAEQHAAMVRWAEWASDEIDGWSTTDQAVEVPHLERLAESVAERFRSNLCD